MIGVSQKFTESGEKMIKYAIFDLDGTLLDSSEMWETLGVRYLGYLKKTPEEGLSDKLREMSLPESAQYLRERYGLPYSAEEIVRHFAHMTEKYYTDDVGFKEGAPKLLAALRAHCVHMSIATAGDERLGMKALMRLGVAEMFSGAVSCSDYGSKITADVFLAAAELIYALPEETIVFENSLAAVRTAQKAGFATAAVADISERDQSGLRRTADFYAENIGEFAESIKELLNCPRG